MKNKKLFAILTLVCFMFTLMPVAAFAAADGYVAVNDDYEVVRIEKGTAEVQLDVTGLTANEWYFVYAVDADGKLYDDMSGLPSEYANGHTAAPEGVLSFQATAVDNTVVVNFADAGTYSVYVTPYTDAMMNVVRNAGFNRTEAQILALLLEDKVTVLDNSVEVKPEKAEYAIVVTDGATAIKNDKNEVIGWDLDLKANSAYTTKTVEVQLVNTADNNKPVVGADLTITTNSSAVDVNKTTVTTNGAGKAKFKVSASTAGDFKIYVEYGTRADATLTVDAGNLEPAKVTTLFAPTAPIALYSYVGAAEVTFSITDANGNVVEGADGKEAPMVRPATNVEGNYKVTVTEKPAGSSIDATELKVNYDADNAVWYLTSDTEIFDEEGTYNFKVTLNNGAYATASVNVKEFQAPVELKMVYKQNAVELDGDALLHKLYYVDANGVTKSLINSTTKEVKEVVLSANGYAIDDFSAKDGKVTVKADEKYVGSKITVLAVSEKYNLTAAAELTVANEAASVKYASTDADVAVNNTLVANIVDADGNKVALNGIVGNASISYIVLDKPENAKVAVSTASNSLAAKGEFKVSFTASEIGTYKLQTVVRYEQTGTEATTNGQPVVKYYSGIEDITVGNTGFEDIVVMSVGSNEIVVNAETVAIDAAPVIENNRTFVPFRALIQAFGAEVAYDEATQAVTAELNGTTVVMTIGSAEYTVNGVAKTADVAPFIAGSRTMVPVRFVAEEFGIKVTPTYDENGATADILFAK